MSNDPIVERPDPAPLPRDTIETGLSVLYAIGNGDPNLAKSLAGMTLAQFDEALKEEWAKRGYNPKVLEALYDPEMSEQARQSELCSRLRALPFDADAMRAAAEPSTATEAAVKESTNA